MRSADSPLEFDLELAKTVGTENPVYYVQYVHARVWNLLSFAMERGISPEGADPSRLTLPEERSLMRRLLFWPDILEKAVTKLEPHRLTHSLLAIARQFHTYYQSVRIVTDDEELSRARLLLSQAVGNVVRQGLDFLGVSAPERM